MVVMRVGLSAALIALAGLAGAQSGLQVRVDADVVRVGESFDIVVEAQGRNVGEPRIPPAPKLVVESLPRRREDQVVVMNQDIAQIKVRVFRAQATRAGFVEIPCVEIAIDGQLVKSPPSTLRVMESGRAAAPEPIPVGSEGIGPRPLPIEEAVFVVGTVTKPEVYAGEATELDLELWAAEGVVILTRSLQVQFPSTAGFYAFPDTPKDMGVERSAHDGRDYTVFRYRQVLYPVKPGVLQVRVLGMERHRRGADFRRDDASSGGVGHRAPHRGRAAPAGASSAIQRGRGVLFT